MSDSIDIHELPFSRRVTRAPHVVGLACDRGKRAAKTPENIGATRGEGRGLERHPAHAVSRPFRFVSAIDKPSELYKVAPAVNTAAGATMTRSDADPELLQLATLFRGRT